MKGVEGCKGVAGERIAAPVSTQRGGREQGLGEPAACVPGLQAAELPPAAEVLMRCKYKQKGGLLRKKAQLSEPERGFQCEPPAPGRNPRGRTGTLRRPKLWKEYHICHRPSTPDFKYTATEHVHQSFHFSHNEYFNVLNIYCIFNIY